MDTVKIEIDVKLANVITYLTDKAIKETPYYQIQKVILTALRAGEQKEEETKSDENNV